LRRPIHEMEIARAASRQIVGPNARVASRHLAWYVSGGAEWYRVESDLTEPTKLENFDPKRYASQFDAVAEYATFSWQTQSGVTPASMYETGSLSLKGFFLPQRMGAIPLMFFQAVKKGGVIGFFLSNDQLQRFDEDASGAWVFVTMHNPRDGYQDPFGGIAAQPNILDYPQYPPKDALSALIVSREKFEARKNALPAGFEIRDAVVGRLSNVDVHALVNASMGSDRPIHFLRMAQERAVANFLARADHLVVEPDGCFLGDFKQTTPERWMNTRTVPWTPGWQSEGADTKVAYFTSLGGDFGGPVVLHGVVVQSPGGAEGIGSAVLMSSDDGYRWVPLAELRFSQNADARFYCVPGLQASRFWKLMATDNPKKHHPWRVGTLTFWR
ncbi:MAG TPA: hypothetical protein VKE70_30550, partial [Candidatus Solibacter sp.]|nr:hypothetical protein [Candidatus Solibacter sp.]